MVGAYSVTILGVIVLMVGCADDGSGEPNHESMLARNRAWNVVEIVNFQRYIKTGSEHG